MQVLICRIAFLIGSALQTEQLDNQWNARADASKQFASLMQLKQVGVAASQLRTGPLPCCPFGGGEQWGSQSRGIDVTSCIHDKYITVDKSTLVVWLLCL